MKCDVSAALLSQASREIRVGEQAENSRGDPADIAWLDQ